MVWSIDRELGWFESGERLRLQQLLEDLGGAADCYIRGSNGTYVRSRTLRKTLLVSTKYLRIGIEILHLL